MATLESLKIAVQTDVGVTREHNEDAVGHVTFEQLKDAVVLVVADGMGGEAAGEVASNMLVDAFKVELERTDREDYRAAMADVIMRTNEQLLEMAAKDPGLRGMGSTVVAVALQDDGFARFVHVGDSRLYHLAGDRFERLTKDHSRVQLFVDEGVLTPEQAEDHPDANVLTQAVGRARIEVDQNEGRSVPWGASTFLVCSDGLTGMLPEPVIERAMKHLDVADVTQVLIDECNRLGAHDNISIAVVRSGVVDEPMTAQEFQLLVPRWIEEYEDAKRARIIEAEASYAAKEAEAIAQSMEATKEYPSTGTGMPDVEEARGADDETTGAAPADSKEAIALDNASVEEATETRASSGGSNWLFAVFAILLIVIAGFYFSRSCSEPDIPVPTVADEDAVESSREPVEADDAVDGSFDALGGSDVTGESNEDGQAPTMGAPGTPTQNEDSAVATQPGTPTPEDVGASAPEERTETSAPSTMDTGNGDEAGTTNRRQGSSNPIGTQSGTTEQLRTRPSGTPESERLQDTRPSRESDETTGEVAQDDPEPRLQDNPSSRPSGANTGQLNEDAARDELSDDTSPSTATKPDGQGAGRANPGPTPGAWDGALPDHPDLRRPDANATP